MLIGADAIYAKFSRLPGHDRMASRYACRGLARWLRRMEPDTICELGAGIGTLSAITSVFAPYALTEFVEPEAWCRARWCENIPSRSSPVATVSCHPGWPDFLIVDGDHQRDMLFYNLPPRATVFFEGRRRPQRRVLEAMWRGGRPFCWAEFKPWTRSKGFSVYLFDPSPSERIWFALVRSREWFLDRAWAGLGLPVGKKRPAR